MTYHAITALVFIAAIGAYVAGSAPGAAALFVGGMFIEGYGWYRVLRKNKSARS